MSSMMVDWFRWIYYEVFYWISFASMALGFSLRYEGGRNLPRRGPVLIIVNHQSYLDPIVVGLAGRRHLTYLARKSLFSNKIFGFHIRTLQAVPVDQDGVAKDGLRAVLKALAQGHAVVVFPEGGRCLDGKLAPLMPGVHLLINRSKAPVLPVGIMGAFQAWPVDQTLPTPAPLFLPGVKSTLGVSIGNLIPPEQLQGLSRTDLLERLRHELEKVCARAEKIRRKP